MYIFSVLNPLVVFHKNLSQSFLRMRIFLKNHCIYNKSSELCYLALLDSCVNSNGWRRTVSFKSALPKRSQEGNPLRLCSDALNHLLESCSEIKKECQPNKNKKASFKSKQIKLTGLESHA